MKKNRYIINNIIKPLSICFLLIVVFSCNNDSFNKKQLILGEWQAIDEIDLDAYSFQEDSICMYKPGYFTYIDKTKKYGVIDLEIFETDDWHSLNITPYFDNIHQFLGSKTTYHIKSDSLFIFNLALQDWNRYKIRFISPDTIQLNNKEREKIFIRKQYRQDVTLPFDQVIVNLGKRDYYSPDHSRTIIPSPDSIDWFRKVISINRSGEAMYYIHYFNRKNSKLEPLQVVGKIDPDDLHYLESLYIQAGIDTFLNKNMVGERYPILRKFSTDFPEIAFVKNNKICSVRLPLDVFKSKEFIYAYLATLYSYQTCITPVKRYTNETNINLFKLEMNFRQGKNILLLSVPEEFYLSTLLYKAKETNQSFTPQYSIKANELIPKYKNVPIETDGRYYRFKQDGKIITLDIGFNFIEINNLKDQFRKEERY